MDATDDSAAPPGGPRPGRRATRAQRTRAALAAAGLDLFARQGVDGTRVEEITRAAGVAKGTFYVHFQRKHDLLLERASTLLESVGQPQQTDSVAAALDDWCGALGRALQRTSPSVVGPMAHELVCNPAAWQRVSAGRPTLEELLVPVLAAAQDRGQLRASPPAPRLARALAALLARALRDWTGADADAPLEASLRDAVALFLHGASEAT